MKVCIEKRQHRLKLAQAQKDTTRQWHLIAAAVEEANIEYHKLSDKQVAKMRGRSKITFKATTQYAFKWVGNHAEEEDVTRMEMLNDIAAKHNVLGNKLKSVSKRMITNARHKEEAGRFADNIEYNKQTLLRYQQIAEKAAKKQDISESQRKQIIDNWCAKKKCKWKDVEHRSETRKTYEKQVDQLQEAANEFASMHKELQQCDTDNIIHAAKIMRIGEEHTKKAQIYRARTVNESTRLRREINSDKTQGGKHL